MTGETLPDGSSAVKCSPDPDTVGDALARRRAMPSALTGKFSPQGFLNRAPVLDPIRRTLP